MRTDKDLQNDILAELMWEPGIRDEDIAVAVKDGVVTLGGTVDTYAQRYRAEKAIERVRGVRAIANDLTVKLPGSYERSDSDIAHAAVNALRWHSELPNDAVQVKLVNGHLTLQGEVDREYQKRGAENAVRYLMGVKSVTNLITLRSMATPADIKQRIRDSLKRQAELDADHVSVEVTGSRIMLRGTVSSLAERRQAERAVWSAPGVATIENNLVVSPPVLAGA
jgi:osmotically-inducible protein OsmY